MTVRAFVLIKTELGAAADVARRIRQVPGVVNASDVTGPYDVIAEAEAITVDDLGRMVVGRVQQIEGITRTLTCPVIQL
ncbi:MAG TPA: Lrp/AsnC ligand binding domain-containing protein [Acidimicrobiales bacterium]|nr:Lrp/AsnC ligand binding domain-containing protein [Acidimicrobiales bacterium]